MVGRISWSKEFLGPKQPEPYYLVSTPYKNDHLLDSWPAMTKPPYEGSLLWHHSDDFSKLHELQIQAVLVIDQKGHSQLFYNFFPSIEDWRGVRCRYLGQHEDFYLTGIPQCIIDNLIAGKPVPPTLSDNPLNYTWVDVENPWRFPEAVVEFYGPMRTPWGDKFQKEYAAEYEPSPDKDKSDNGLNINEIVGRVSTNRNRLKGQAVIPASKRAVRQKKKRRNNTRRVQHKIQKHVNKKKKVSKNRKRRK